MINNVVLVGNLTKDPESRTTSTGTSVASFRLAWNDSFSRNGQDKTSVFIDVTVFGKTADFVLKNMRKGTTAAVVGRLNQRKYTSTKTNTEVTVTEIIANTVEFAGPKSASKTDDSGFQSDIPTSTPVHTGFDSGFNDTQNRESDIPSDLDINDDSLPFI